MINHRDENNPGLKTGNSISGFTIDKITTLTEITAVLYELTHVKTGAKHIHISNSDKENTFSVAFKTVPADSTGVAHILEHTVLCGSGRFNVRDPFFSMLKRSLNTFMNAFTASDWTMYPFSTMNKKDYFNLMDVYTDAVFFPNIDELSFKQEGHRLEFDTEKDGEPLVYKGVVYNEMKGAMSSPDQVMTRSLLNALYPSTTYRFNSGGSPEDIPNVTWEELRAFHGRHYHPSNAFFYTYGNLPLKDSLDFIDKKILCKFEKIDPQTDVPSQPRWSGPKQQTYSYPLDKDEDPSKKYQGAVAWLLSDIKDTFEVLVLTILEQVLLANPASPLHKALIDSELGSSMSDGTGFDAENRDTMFACGLKDIELSAVEKVNKIVMDTMEKLSTDGIDKELVESAIHQIEFYQKEITNAPYPYGLKLLLRFSGSWFHGGSPAENLEFDADLKKLTDALDRGPFLEKRIKKHFIDNPHRVLFTLAPDQEMADEEAIRLEAELDRIKKKMTPEKLQAIKDDTLALEKLQESEEDLSSLPTLTLEDVPPDINMVSESPGYEDFSSTCYNQPTSGILYFSAVADMDDLPEHLISLVPFFCTAFSRIGTRTKDYMELARFLDACTGGLGLSSHVSKSFDTVGACLTFSSLNGKCLNRNIAPMFKIIHELVTEYDYSNLSRLKTLLLEYKAGVESTIVHNGHKYAISLASRNFSESCRLSEVWHGVHQFQFIKGLTEGFDDPDIAEKKLSTLSRDLHAIADHFFTLGNLKTALIGDDEAIREAAPLVETLKGQLKPARTKTEKHAMAAPGNQTFEGWSTNTAVSFVGSTFEAVRMEHEDAPCLAVISRLLRSSYLHREIREKGGAYGGFAIYNMEEGLFCLGSYRDPHIVNTINVFESAANFIRSGKFKEEDIKEAILQVCSDIDKPDTPGPSARKAFYRTIISLTDGMRERFKKNLLALSRQQVVEVADRYFSLEPDKKAVAVISSEKLLTAANEKLSPRKLDLKKI